MNTGEQALQPRGNSANRHKFALYVGVVTAVTVIVISLLLWSLTIDTFVTRVRVQLDFPMKTGAAQSRHNDSLNAASQDGESLPPPSADEAALLVNANRRIAASIARLTTDEHLDDFTKEIAVGQALRSRVLNERDFDKLRGAIKVATRPGRAPTKVDLQIALTGCGTHDEIEFINRLANALANDLTHHATNNDAEKQISNWLTSLDQQLGAQHETHAGFTSLLQEELAAAIRKRNQFFELLPNLTSVQQGPQAAEDRSGRIQREIAQLRQQMQEQQAQFNWPANHPQILGYQTTIDNLTAELNQLRQRGGQRRIDNQFFMASSNNNRRDSLSDVLETIQLDELDRGELMVQRYIENLDAEKRSQLDLISQMREATGHLFHNTKSVRLERLELAHASEPMASMPSNRQLLSIALLATLLGGVLAWQYRPEMRIHKFRSTDHIAQTLGVPVVGTIRDKTSRPPARVKATILRSVFRVCEVLLIGVAILLVITMLAHSELFGLALRNPVEAVSKLVWTISPR